ncbi:hypothetical protein Tco_0331964 [Tanacetum coccineum]
MDSICWKNLGKICADYFQPSEGMETQCRGDSYDCIVVLVSDPFDPSRFNEIQLFLVALNAELKVFNRMSDIQLSLRVHRLTAVESICLSKPGR